MARAKQKSGQTSHASLIRSQTVCRNGVRKKYRINNSNSCKIDCISKLKPKKPPKFSWIEDGLLAGHGRPTQHEHIKYLCDSGVKYLVTLTVNKPKALVEYPGEGLIWVHIPVQDETVPTMSQIQQFIELVCKARTEQVAVAVHCAWGQGRTGTMLACYLAYCENLTGQEAIEKIRNIRPKSIDTEEQKNVVKRYAMFIAADKLKKGKSSKKGQKLKKK